MDPYHGHLGEQRVIFPNGKTAFVETIAFKTTFNGDEAVQVIVRDITQQKKAEARADYLAYYDTLTGLPNRNLIHKLINKSISRSLKGKSKIAVMYIDLDRFK